MTSQTMGGAGVNEVNGVPPEGILSYHRKINLLF
jgi:hypothetical protein